MNVKRDRKGLYSMYVVSFIAQNGQASNQKKIKQPKVLLFNCSDAKMC